MTAPHDELLRTINRLIEGERVSGDQVSEFLHYLILLVLSTALHQRPRPRDLLATTPQERRKPRASIYDQGTLLWLGESYVESFYPEVFDELRPMLRSLKTPTARWRRLRGSFIEWLHHTWQAEATERPYQAQMPETALEPMEADNAVPSLASKEQDPLDRLEALRADLRRYCDPIEAFIERNRTVRQWRPFIELLYDTKGELRFLVQRHRQNVQVPSQQDVDECWFRALWAIVCRKRPGYRVMQVRELARVTGINPSKVDHLVSLERQFQASRQAKS